MIPTVEDVKSSPLVHRLGDYFNPPGLTNFWGCSQVDRDITGVRNITYPPFSCSDVATCVLYLNGRYFPSLGCPITYVWYPDRIERIAEYQEMVLTSITAMVPNEKITLVQLTVESKSGKSREIDLRFRTQGTVTKRIESWMEVLSPLEIDNEFEIDASNNMIIHKAKGSTAFSIHGLHPKAEKINEYGFGIKTCLSAGEAKTWTLIHVVGETLSEVQNSYSKMVREINTVFDDIREYWNDELKAVFTPGNSRYSGFLPTLVTDDDDILRLYHTGILGVIYFKRDNPYSVYGRAYDTLMPKHWQTVTFLWDYSLSSLVHAILDPIVMRKYLECWMQMDIHKHFGTEYLKGNPVGPWYSVNNFAMLCIANDYLRWSGHTDWLKKEITSKREGNKSDNLIWQTLYDYSLNWLNYQTEDGIADYGGINNLLECVSSYIHGVVSLNAANVFNMRFILQLLKILGEEKLGKKLVREVTSLLKTLQKLYVDGKGYWYSRFPDGKFVEVKHCYDFITVLNTIPDDLSSKQKLEISKFFVNELKTPTWMRALSDRDNDAIFSLRPDHQWNGAYPAWPAQAVTGLYNIGQTDLAFTWLKSMASTANQGPFGQAHFIESMMNPDSGGARKAPNEYPYMCDWACSSGGAWARIIIESIFGVKATLNNGITAEPNFGAFDRNAELNNLHYQGDLYNVNRNGIKKI
ncbi:MAG: hypothetical protein ISS19_06975 [Bacteroidales bacterium]|nr:hypothetical protein [Bacteroidales bacterium]